MNNTLIIAAAGSGKTTELIRLIKEKKRNYQAIKF